MAEGELGAEQASLGGTTAKGVTLVIAQVLPVMAIVSLLPAIPKLMEHFHNVPNVGLLIGMVVTLPSLCVALFAPVAGWVADRFGRRSCFVAGMGLYVVAGMAPLFLDSLPLIVASRALLGIAEGCVITVSSTLIADYFGEARYRWLAWSSVTTSICGTLLIAVGGALADISWRGPFAVYALAFPGFLLAFFLIDEPVASHSRGGPDHSRVLGFPWREAMVIGSVTLLASVLYYVEPLHIATILTLNGVESATRVGIIQAATSIAYIAGAFLYKRLHHRPTGQLLTLAGMLIGAGLLLIAVSPDYRWVAAGATIQQLGAGMVIPTLLAWGQARLPIEQRGRGMGIWATSFFAGMFVCTPVVALVAGESGGLQPAMLALGVATMVISLLPGIFFGRTPVIQRTRN